MGPGWASEAYTGCVCDAGVSVGVRCDIGRGGVSSDAGVSVVLGVTLGGVMCVMMQVCLLC